MDCLYTHISTDPHFNQNIPVIVIFNTKIPANMNIRNECDHQI
jgi:hypothetical protein